MKTRIPTMVLIAAFLSSCAPPEQLVSINFVGRYEGNLIVCAGEQVSLTDLRLYVSDVALIRADGEYERLQMDSRFGQNRAVALIDLETGSESCANGTAGGARMVIGEVPVGEYSGIAFTLGVPFELNHQDPLSAEAPLGDPDMHWHWRGGYKFLRAGVATEAASSWIHLGSTGCEGTIQNITHCVAPNRVRVELDPFDPLTDVVAIDLGELLRLPEEGITSCSSGPSDTSCAPSFEALGLTGNQVQTVFQTWQLPRP